MNLFIEDIVKVIEKVNVRNVIILLNNKNIFMVV